MPDVKTMATATLRWENNGRGDHEMGNQWQQLVRWATAMASEGKGNKKQQYEQNRPHFTIKLSV